MKIEQLVVNAPLTLLDKEESNFNQICKLGVYRFDKTFIPIDYDKLVSLVFVIGVGAQSKGNIVDIPLKCVNDKDVFEVRKVQSFIQDGSSFQMKKLGLEYPIKRFTQKQEITFTIAEEENGFYLEGILGREVLNFPTVYDDDPTRIIPTESNPSYCKFNIPINYIERCDVHVRYLSNKDDCGEEQKEKE